MYLSRLTFHTQPGKTRAVEQELRRLVAGGIGVLHRNLSVEDQAAQVDLVKRSESGMIVDPVTIR